MIYLLLVDRICDQGNSLVLLYKNKTEYLRNYHEIDQGLWYIHEINKSLCNLLVGKENMAQILKSAKMHKWNNVEIFVNYFNIMRHDESVIFRASLQRKRPLA